MHPETSASIARLLDHVDDAQRDHLASIFPLIYEDLRRIAQRYMHGQRSSHTLQATALVNEAYLKIERHGGALVHREHALALAAVAMRNILVDHARGKATLKRNGTPGISLQGADANDDRALEVLELDDLLQRLAALDPRRARVVELKFFAGMTNEEIATALSLARSTVAEDWAVARAWLRVQLGVASGSKR